MKEGKIVAINNELLFIIENTITEIIIFYKTLLIYFQIDRSNYMTH